MPTVLLQIIHDPMAHRTISRLRAVNKHWHEMADADWVWMLVAITRWPDNFRLTNCRCSKNKSRKRPPPPPAIIAAIIIGGYHPVQCFSNTAVDCWRVNVCQGTRRDQALAHQLGRHPGSQQPAFHPRNSLRAHCVECQRPFNACLCAVLSRLEVICNCDLRLIVLLHPKCPLGTGTLRLLVKLLRHCTVFCGVDFSEGRFPELDRMLESAGGNCFMLYPSAEAVEINQIKNATGPTLLDTATNSDDDNNTTTTTKTKKKKKTTTLIAIDGTWTQVKWICRWNSIRFSKFPKIRLNPSGPAVYSQIKNEPRADCLSTAEAVAMSMDQLVSSNDARCQLCSCGKHQQGSSPPRVTESILPALEEIVRIQIGFAAERRRKQAAELQGR